MQKNAYEYVGARIKKIRGEVSQKNFLKKLEIYDILNCTTLSKIENNQIPPPMNLLVAISTHYSMTMDEIAFGNVLSEVSDFRLIYSKLNEVDKNMLIKVCLKVAEQFEKDNTFDYNSEDDFSVKKLDWQIRLAEIRRLLRMSNDEFKAKIGKSVKTAYYHENCEELPPYKYCCQFASVANVSLDYIFHGTFCCYPLILSDVLYEYNFDKQKQIILQWAEVAKKVMIK